MLQRRSWSSWSWISEQIIYLQIHATRPVSLLPTFSSLINKSLTSTMQSLLSTMKNFMLIASLLISGSLATSPAKTCTDYEIPLTIESLNYIIAKQFQSNYDVVDLLSNASSRTAGTEFQPYSGSANESANYTISATFCTPTDTASRNGIVLLASHGLNFDRRSRSTSLIWVLCARYWFSSSYWDPSISPTNYSFVDFAIASGYSVFYYDRLGVGKSSLSVLLPSICWTSLTIKQSFWVYRSSVKPSRYSAGTGTCSQSRELHGCSWNS